MSYLPLKEWRRRWGEMLAAIEAAHAEANSFLERRGNALVVPWPSTPEWAAHLQVYWRRVVPAYRAEREWFDTHMYTDSEPERREVRKQETAGAGASLQQHRVLREQILTKLREQPGISKAALIRAVAGEDARSRPPAEKLFAAMCVEGVCHYDAPTTAGGAGKCTLVTTGVEPFCP
jgi:hypothetical protein